MDEWYFAYGSNLCVDQMVDRTGPFPPGGEPPRPARLAGYQLVFNAGGEDGQVFANIVQPGDGVLGVVYRCGPAALAALDTYEHGYERRRVTVLDAAGAALPAVAYMATAVVPAGRPSAAYLARIIRGARHHGLSAEYIRTIEAAAGVAGEHIRT